MIRELSDIKQSIQTIFHLFLVRSPTKESPSHEKYVTAKERSLSIVDAKKVDHELLRVRTKALSKLRSDKTANIYLNRNAHVFSCTEISQ